MGTIVSLLDVQGGGSRSEEEGDWERVGTNFDGGWGSSARGWNITEFNIVSGLDSSFDNLAGTTTVTTETTTETTATAHTAITAGRSATTITTTATTTISGGNSDKS